MEPFIRTTPYIGNVTAVIFDWAGTTVDFGCFAPLDVFIEIFRDRGVDITVEEARQPMGLMKRDHIAALCSMDRIRNLWSGRHGSVPGETDIDDLYGSFEPKLLGILPGYSKPIPGVVELVKSLRECGVRIGSTTGYTTPMMEVLAPRAAEKGYTPDAMVTSSDTPAGRPYPWMVFKNMIDLQVYPAESIVKVGDTVADIHEGLNAGTWTVGVLLGGSVVGLRQEEAENMTKDKLEPVVESARKKLSGAGAHYVMDKITDLPGVIEDINIKLAAGKLPQ